MNGLTSHKYQSEEGSLLNAASDQVVDMGDVNTGYAVIIDNDATSDDFTVKFSKDTNTSRTVKGGETLTLSEFEFTGIYLSNASGSTIAYRIFIAGY